MLSVALLVFAINTFYHARHPLSMAALYSSLVAFTRALLTFSGFSTDFHSLQNRLNPANSFKPLDFRHPHSTRHSPFE
jgi:hypothetical protein